MLVVISNFNCMCRNSILLLNALSFLANGISTHKKKAGTLFSIEGSIKVEQEWRAILDQEKVECDGLSNSYSLNNNFSNLSKRQQQNRGLRAHFKHTHPREKKKKKNLITWQILVHVISNFSWTCRNEFLRLTSF